MSLTTEVWTQKSVVLVGLRMATLDSVGLKCHLWPLFWWGAHKTKDSGLASKAGLFRWAASPKNVPKEEAKSGGDGVEAWPQELSWGQCSVQALQCSGLSALSFCNRGQIGTKGNLQVLDVQSSNSFWSVPFVGGSLKLGSQTQHKEGKK